MKPKRWNTAKLALYGAAFGVVVTTVQAAIGTADLSFQSTDWIARSVGHVSGAAIGGALLFASVSGIRNLAARV